MEIYSKLVNKEIEDALQACLTSDIKESCRILWNLVKDIEGDREFHELKHKIKTEGFILKFDLRKVIYGEVEEYPDSGLIRIKGCEKVNLEEYWDELEKREKEMKELIRDQYDEGWQSEIYDKKYDKDE